MSDFGNQTSSAALHAGEKSIEALLKFFKFLLERKEKRINAELQKQRLDEMKLTNVQRTAKLKVEGKVGYVKAKLLQRTGEPLVGIKISLNEQQMKDFAKLAKKYGLLYTSISDTRQSGEKVHTFFVREKDLATAKTITDRMTEDMQLKAVDDKIAEINSIPNKSEQDIADLAYLQEQKDVILRNGTRSFNEENAEIIFNDVCGMMQDGALSFDRALNRFTDRDFSRDTPYYICERTNPTSYIELVSTYDEFAGEQYTRTDYKVFNKGVEQVPNAEFGKDGKFTDERFEGRPQYYWHHLKAAMKAKGGFTDDIVIFKTKEEFERYQQLYIESVKDNALHEVKGGEYRDYASIIDQLKDQLKENNAELNGDSVAVDMVTKEPLTITDALTEEEAIKVAESTLIAKQIINYKALSEAEVKLAMDKQLLESTNNNLASMKDNDSEYENTITERTTLAAEIKSCELKIEKGLLTEKELATERNQISGIYAVYAVDKEYDAEHEQHNKELANNKEDKEIYPGEAAVERNTMTIEEWKGQVSERREIPAANTPEIPIKNFDKAISGLEDR